MRTRGNLLCVALAVSCVLAPVAWAEEAESPPSGSTRRAAAGGRSRVQVEKEDLPEPEPFPWMAVLLTGLTFLVVGPFAWRYYVETSGQLAGRRGERTRGSGRPSRLDRDGSA
jgi:hypothetical protein